MQTLFFPWTSYGSEAQNIGKAGSPRPSMIELLLFKKFTRNLKDVGIGVYNLSGTDSGRGD
jgi:hypothetical protein